MAQKEFITYDGVKYEKIMGEEILDSNKKPTGYYKLDMESREIITVLGTWLDNTANVEQFEKDFYAELDLTESQYSTPYSHNFILIGKNIIYSFNRFNSIIHTNTPDKSKEKIFNVLIDSIKDLGYMNQAPEFIYDNNILCKKIKFILIDRITQKPFEVYFIPLDYISIKIGDK